MKGESIASLRLSISRWKRKLSLAQAKCFAYGEIIERSERVFLRAPSNQLIFRSKTVTVKVGDVTVAKAKKEQDRIRRTKIAFYEERISELSKKLNEFLLVQGVLDQ